MEYINHVTLNSGHIRKTYPDEIDKELYFFLNRIWKDSQYGSGVELFDGYVLKSTKIEQGAIGTIFKESTPIITVAAVNSDDGTIWRKLHETYVLGEELATNLDEPMDTPYIADRLEVGAITHIDAMLWTGDFSRCFGWIVLAPEKIR